MSGSHEKLPTIFWVQIVLVLIVGTIYLMTPAAPKHHGGEEAAKHEVNAETKTALKPVGEVAVKKESGASGASRSGEDIVKKTCAACHIAGIANAPKLDASAKDAWVTRMTATNGLDGLVASAQKGKGAMPPNGADPSLSADEMKAAIVNMLEQAGVEVAAADKAPAKTAESKPADASATEATKEVTDKAEPAAEKTATTTAAPVTKEVADKAEPVAEKTATTTAAPVATEKLAAKAVVETEEVKAPTEPEVPVAPKAEAAELTPPAKAEIVKAPVAPEAATAPTAPKAEAMPEIPAPTPTVEATEAVSTPTPVAAVPVVEKAVVAPKAEEKPVPAAPTEAPAPKAEESQPAEPVPAAPAASAATKEAAPAVDLVAGEKTYKTICFSCHDLAIANAPKPGDKAAWIPRIAKGMDVLYTSAIKGDPKMPAMPAKGGNPNLSDSEVRNAVSYMVELSK